MTISMSIVEFWGGKADGGPHRGEHSVDHFGPFAEAGNAVLEALDEERLGFDGLEFERHVYWCWVWCDLAVTRDEKYLKNMTLLSALRHILLALVLDDADE